MTAHSPFNARSNRSHGAVSNWSLLGVGEDAEVGRLERYCSEMNARDPYRRLWFVATAEGGKRYVESRSREIHERVGERQATGNPILDREPS